MREISVSSLKVSADTPTRSRSRSPMPEGPAGRSNTEDKARCAALGTVLTPGRKDPIAGNRSLKQGGRRAFRPDMMEEEEEEEEEEELAEAAAEAEAEAVGPSKPVSRLKDRQRWSGGSGRESARERQRKEGRTQHTQEACRKQREEATNIPYRE
eukprot:1066712-Prorocentrum_minimum.AAC.1